VVSAQQLTRQRFALLFSGPAVRRAPLAAVADTRLLKRCET
jgi:hypothetical protein